MGSGAHRLAQTEPLDAAEALVAATAAAWRWTVGAPVVSWSERAPAILGVPEIVLRSPDLILKAVHPADLALVSDPAAKSWAAGIPVSSRFRVCLAQKIRWIEASGRVVHGADGVPAYVTGVARDITETQEAEAAVVEALHEAEAVLAQLGAGVGEWDSKSNVVKMFTGPSGLGESTPGEVPLEAILHNMDDLGRSRLRAALPRSIVDDEPFMVEVKMKASDGAVRRVMVKGGPSHESAGRVRLVALVLGCADELEVLE